MTDSMSQRPKRFYNSVTLSGEGPFGIRLDGRDLKTPAKAALSLPSRALADAICAEWSAQGPELDLTNMHLTRLANVAVDRTPATREALANEVANYASTDLLCHLADGPAALVERQQAGWGPIRDWAGRALGVLLIPVEGILAPPQPLASLQAVTNHALDLDDFRLTGLAYACGLYGSALLALSVEQGHLSAEDAFTLSRIDEAYQIERWGEDSEAKAALALRHKEIEAISVWFKAL